MARVATLDGFNNLLFATNRRAECEKLEHRAGRVGLDFSYKGEAPICNVLTAGASQINGKRYDLKYVPTEIHSRPYYGYDARFDPTILNSVRNQYVDVSGLLIPNKDLPKHKVNMNATVHPLISYEYIR